MQPYLNTPARRGNESGPRARREKKRAGLPVTVVLPRPQLLLVGYWLARDPSTVQLWGVGSFPPASRTLATVVAVLHLSSRGLFSVACLWLEYG